MLLEEYIKIMLFTILCICFIFYLFLGIYSYKKDKESKVNIKFLILCISASLWAIGYAFMLISPNIKTANIWRIVAALGWCFFSGLWVSFAFSLMDTKQKNSFNFKIKFPLYMYIISMIFFISNLMYEPSKLLSSEAYGFVDNLYSTTTIGTIFTIYFVVSYIAGFAIILHEGKNSQKNRVRIQIKTILNTTLITFCLIVISDAILHELDIMAFPSGIIMISIGMGGIWYAINKHKMMAISYKLVSKYIFGAVNEPIFILDEDFFIKNSNEALLNITGYNYMNLGQHSLDSIMSFKNSNLNDIIKSENFTNVEVALYRKNKEDLICELSATVIYDEYKDLLGIVVLLHDVTERKKVADIQKKYTLKLEESNIKLKNEIRDRRFAEEKISHLAYYDALTELSNRKKMLEDINILIGNKNEKFAVLFIDLDKFKSANDNYGHQAGDNILKTVAVRLKSIIRLTDTIYRIGGDEFIIILRNLKDYANAKKIALATRDILSTVFTYKTNQLFIGVSVGISIFPEHGINADTLIKNADFAMYEAKRKGGNGYKIYSSSTL